MKKVILVTILALPALFFCTPKKAHENGMVADSVRVTQLDYSSPEKFIRTLIENRNKANPRDFKIKGNLVFSNGDFHVINFVEQMGIYAYPYTVVLNPEEKRGFDNPDKSTYIDVQALLISDGSNVAVFSGSFTVSEDFQGDGSPDFILEVGSNFRNEVNGKQTIVLYSKDNKLTVTNIEAISAFESGAGEGSEGFLGVRETFEMERKGAVPTIIVHRTEDEYSKKTFTYDKLWKWSKTDGVWKTGFICAGIEKNPYYRLFSEKLTGLVSKDAAFVIQENCQNGGAPFFLLKRTSSEMSDFFVIQTDEDDVGFDAVVSIQKEDTLTYKMILVRGGEEFEPNLTGMSSVYPSDPITVTRDSVHQDILWFRYSRDPNRFPKTSSPDRYELIKCN